MAFFACGTRDELRARRSGGRPFIDGRPNKRIFHARMYSERDGLSGWTVFRKVCPRIGAQSGPHFPVDVLSGNYVPELRLGMGCTFRLRALAESATRNIALKRDAVSPTRLNRKAHPILGRQNGMRFPRDRIYAAVLSDSPATRPESATRALPGCPPRSRRRWLPTLRGHGSPR